MESGSVSMRKTVRLVVESRHDVRVEISVPITPHEGAAGIGRADEPIVNDTAAQSRISRNIQTKMTRCGRAVIDAAVRYIDGESRGGELPLGEPFAGQPGQVART